MAKKYRDLNKKQTGQAPGQRAEKEFFIKVLLMQEEEKKRISRDLHDETGQMVIGLGALLNIIENELKTGNIEKALALIDEQRQMVQEIARRMKSMALNLRPPALDILGLAAVLREHFSQCTKSNPITIEFNENIKYKKLGENVEITLYRIVQEAVYNVIKHSMATEVKVDLILKDKVLRLVIVDNGRGFDVEKHAGSYDPNKLGLRGIKERTDILKGSFFIESAPERGTKLTITLPLDYTS